MVRRYALLVVMSLGLGMLQAQDQAKIDEAKREAELAQSVESLKKDLQQAVTQLKEIAKEEVGKKIDEAAEAIAPQAEQQTSDTQVPVTASEQKPSFWKSIFSGKFSEGVSAETTPLWLALLLFFLMGVAASFTPCIYPMIPITLGILQSQASPSIGRNFMLSASYVAGMATVYAVLGYFVATTGLMLGQWLANPWLIGFLILLFIYLAFSMFGFYEIWMPRFMQRGTNVQVKGSYLYSFLFGAASGTVASPCLTPAVVLLIGFVAKIGSPLIGFLSFFVFALGMGMLLLVIGTFSNSLNALPRAGMWMNEVKKIFGFLLIGVAIYFAKPFIGTHFASNLNWLLVGVAVAYYAMVIFKKFLK